MNLPKAWNAKLGAGSFFPSKNLYRKCARFKKDFGHSPFLCVVSNLPLIKGFWIFLNFMPSTGAWKTNLFWYGRDEWQISFHWRQKSRWAISRTNLEHRILSSVFGSDPSSLEICKGSNLNSDGHFGSSLAFLLYIGLANFLITGGKSRVFLGRFLSASLKVA